jgi:hypothetical protein
MRRSDQAVATGSIRQQTIGIAHRSTTRRPMLRVYLRSSLLPGIPLIMHTRAPSPATIRVRPAHRVPAHQATPSGRCRAAQSQWPIGRPPDRHQHSERLASRLSAVRIVRRPRVSCRMGNPPSPGTSGHVAVQRVRSSSSNRSPASAALFQQTHRQCARSWCELPQGHLGWWDWIRRHHCPEASSWSKVPAPWPGRESRGVPAHAHREGT